MEQEEEKKTLVSVTISISEEQVADVEKERVIDDRPSFSNAVVVLLKEAIAARKKAREDNKTD